MALRDVLVPLAENINAVAVEGVSKQDLETTRRTLLTMIGNLAGDERQALADGLKITATRELAFKS